MKKLYLFPFFLLFLYTCLFSYSAYSNSHRTLIHYHIEKKHLTTDHLSHLEPNINTAYDTKAKLPKKDNKYGNSYAFSFNLVYKNTSDDFSAPNIDFRKQQNLLVKHVRKIILTTKTIILSNRSSENTYLTSLKELRRKSKWDIEDRVYWEIYLSQYVSDEIDKIPGLDRYRSTNNEEKKADIRTKMLNKLAHDIRYNTQTIEFDCEAMSIVEGIIIQNIENALLPKQKKRRPVFKARMNYYYMVGNVIFDESDKPASHAYILTPTLNIIESTVRQEIRPKTSYFLNVNPNITMEDIFSGKPQAVFNIYRGDISTYIAGYNESYFNDISSVTSHPATDKIRKNLKSHY